jgi:hypothetical protein
VPVRKVHRPGPASGVLAVSITAVIGHGPLRRLLLLDPPPPGCAAAAQPRLDLAYCFSCADGWEPAFHLHDTDGRPRPLDQTMRKLPLNSFEGEDVRPAIAAKVMRTPPRWQHQDWAMANDRENLNRIGGEPTWIQDPGYPACPSCQAAMPFQRTSPTSCGASRAPSAPSSFSAPNGQTPCTDSYNDRATIRTHLPHWLRRRSGSRF